MAPSKSERGSGSDSSTAGESIAAAKTGRARESQADDVKALLPPVGKFAVTPRKLLNSAFISPHSDRDAEGSVHPSELEYTPKAPSVSSTIAHFSKSAAQSGKVSGVHQLGHEEDEEAQVPAVSPKRSASYRSESPLFEPEGSPLLMRKPMKTYGSARLTRSSTSSSTSGMDTTSDITDSDFRPDARGRSDPAMRRTVAFKKDLEASSSMFSTKFKKAPGRKLVELDPENILIMELHVEHKMSWMAIANYLNEQRLERGEPATFTQAAVYSRYIRNSPRIAANQGIVDFDPKDYLYMRHPHNYPTYVTDEHRTLPFLGNGKASAKKRDRDAYEHSDGNGDDMDGIPKEIRGNIRTSGNLAEQARELEKTEHTTKLVKAVALVQANLWTYVADEMERVTGRLFDAKALESRYKTIN